MPRYASHFTFIIALVIVISSCGEIEEPLPEAIIDIHIISGPEEGAVIDEPSATFQWGGSNRLVSEFSYRLLPLQQEWSQWSSNVSTSFEKLDEESYTFEIRGRYEPGNETDAPVQRHFSVDIPYDLILMVQSDKSVYSLDETAKFTVTLRNTSDSSMFLSFPPDNPLIGIMDKRTESTTLLSQDGLIQGLDDENYLVVERGDKGKVTGGSTDVYLRPLDEWVPDPISWNFERDSDDLVSSGDYQVTPGMGFAEKGRDSIEAIALSCVYPNVPIDIKPDPDMYLIDKLKKIMEYLFLGPYIDIDHLFASLFAIGSRATSLGSQNLQSVNVVAYPISITIVDR